MRAKCWASEVEDGARKQIENISKLPFLFKYAAIMPDVHQGYGVPIGCVLATKGVIIPNAVGVDIGCGMCFAETNLDVGVVSIQKTIDAILEVIPVGFAHHAKPHNIPIVNDLPTGKLYDDLFPAAAYQLGTLGGGNHFIELQASEDNKICIMIHSGSRNIGKRVADYYNEKAKELNLKYFSKVPLDIDLAFLPLDTDEAREYIDFMNYCISFAKANRTAMMNVVLDILGVDIIGGIDCKHNFARMENHFGENVMIHRKGAICANEGNIVIIPGAMGSYSYIGTGLNSSDSFRSCSHGAGRTMSRKKAKELKVSFDFVLGKKDLSDAAEECKEAYKDIDVVMAQQRDLVKPIMKLKTLGVVKG